MIDSDYAGLELDGTERKSCAALSTRSPLAAEARSARALLDKRDQAISPLGSLGSRGDT